MASNYRFIDPGAAFPALSNTGTFNTSSGPGAPVAFGLIAGAVDPTYGYAEFMFVQGSTNAAGDLCLVQGGTCAVQYGSASTATQGPLGIAPAAMTATNVYGWIQILGICDYANMGTQGTTAAGQPVFIGSTAGRLQTTAGATGYILGGIKISQYSTTANSNSGILQLYYPCFDGNRTIA